jgi:hypothetical protein
VKTLTLSGEGAATLGEGCSVAYESVLPPVQRKMLALLSDGLPHSREELHACLADELGPITNVAPHVSMIRRAVRLNGEEIVCEYVKRRICYRHVRLLVTMDGEG